MTLGDGSGVLELPHELDDLNDIVDLASNVVVDYGAADTSRITRLARWVIANLSDIVVDPDRIQRLLNEHGITVWASIADGQVGVGLRLMSPDDARAYAATILRAADLAEL